MVLQDWTLGTLLQDLRTEFGLADTGEANTALASAINKAQAWVVRRRPNWPWLRKEHLIDVPVATSATVTVTQGSRTVVSTSLPTVRDVFVAGESLADGTDGYLVTAVGAGSFTLQSQYRSANATGASCTFQKGWFQLPDDFLRRGAAAAEPGIIRVLQMTSRTPHRSLSPIGQRISPGESGVNQESEPGQITPPR